MTDLRIVRSPGVISGSWRLAGTRMPAKLIHDLVVVEGMSTEAILSWYPRLSAEEITYCVDWFTRAYGRKETPQC